MMKRRTHEIPIEDEPRKRHDSPEAEATEAPPEPEAEGKLSYEQVVDQLQRLQAEFSNYRRRVERDRVETTLWAQRALIEKLVPVLDDLERATNSVSGETGPAAQGLALIREKLLAVLTEAGLERIPTREETFDPERHEALTTQRVEPERSGKVIEELDPGFTFRGKLVRPARVTVGVDESGDVSGPRFQ
ncbi:MAG TPA: nucleotide exchange factor GrpE [Candidatus Eisenbacteria bacterium]|nr:nucleotide exchange factor GrpE [Candidatus Eisenbacteria bacterium]